MAFTNLLLFGDQTVEKLSSIQSLVRHSKTSYLARTFLEQATDIVQLEFSRLSAEEREWPLEVSSLLSMAEENIRRPESNGIVATVLMCIGRIGELIVYAEEDPSILGSEQSPTKILALCTGMLPAAVAAAARDTSELVKIGIEMVSITFRMAFEVSRRMRLVEDVGGNWATTVLGVDRKRMQTLLDDFHASQNIPESRKLAIGIVATGWLTLIGPPSSLDRLWRWSPELDNAAKTTTDTNGPIHTSHMPFIDLDKVLGDSAILKTPISSKAKLIRNSVEGWFAEKNLGSLLREMITEIAHKTLRLSDTIDECLTSFKTERKKVRLTVVGPTGHLPTVQRDLQVKKVTFEINEHIDKPSTLPQRGSDHIAVVGMAGRFPGSETLEGFWQNLQAGKNFIREVPKSRWDVDEFYDPTGQKKNSTTARHGGWLDRPGAFDNKLFNISPREANQMDPIQRLLLTASYEALEVAGYSPDATPATAGNRIATYFGQTSDDWHEILNNEGVDIYYVPSLARAFGPSRLNYNYKWGGGSYAIDSACATSTTGISLACSALQARDCDMAMAGGGSVLVSPNSFAGLAKSGMISTTGGCRTYHDDADGYARGEAVAVVVLKRLEDAISDNDNILGVIRGSARTYSSTATSITHPDGEAQGRVFDNVLRQTCVDPQDIGYVEMHGTGTQAGDATEMESVLGAVGQARTKDNPLMVGAVKAALGHGEAAAGVTSLIKVLMMMRHRQVPPQPDMPFKMNRNFPPLGKMNVHIAEKGLKLQPRPDGDGKAKVLLNSFDASGGNTSLLLEDGPEPVLKAEDARPYHVVALSGRSATSLQGNTARLLEYLERHPETKLADLAYTSTARRMHQPMRTAFTAAATSELIGLLRTSATKQDAKDLGRKNAKSPTIFAFTGQGVQCIAMGKDLFKRSPTFREILMTYQEMALTLGLPRFIDLIADGCPDLTSEVPSRSHLAIVALEIAVAQTLKAWGVQPDLVIGHSLGEYAALAAAGVLSISDTLHLVGQRARLIEKHLEPDKFSMLATRKNVEEIQAVIERANLDSAEIACKNAPNVTVVSSTKSEADALQRHLGERGLKSTPLKISYGFHSKQMDPILRTYESIAKGVVFNKATVPVASTLLGTVTHEVSSSYLARQCREPVDFLGALNASDKAGFVTERTRWVEIGPEPILTGLISSTVNTSPDRLLPTLKSNENNWKTVSMCLAGLYQSGTLINWPEYHKDFKDSLSLLELPTYAFDEKDYWTPYKEPEKLATSNDSKAGGQSSAAAAIPSFASPSLQRLESEDIKGEDVQVIFASHTSHPDLLATIQGHVVDDIVICPLSVFCDMALSASSYIHSKLPSGKLSSKMAIYGIELTQPLLVEEVNPSQVVKVTASYSAKSKQVKVSFSSTDGATSIEHGGCHVSFEDSDEWLTRFGQTKFLLKSRITSLKESAQVGNSYRLFKPMVYRLFSKLVDYGEKYKAMDEVTFDTSYEDAFAKVTLPSVEGTGNFQFSPYWTDSTVHLAGFLVNGSMKYPDDIGCLSTGFDSWRQLKPLSAGKPYSCYVCMQEADKGGAITGDAYVFDGEELVVATQGIHFQKMKRAVLRALLMPTGSKHEAARNSKSANSKNASKGKQNTRFSKSRSGRDRTVPVETPALSSPGSASPDSSPERAVMTPAGESSGSNAEVVDKLLAAVANESGYEIEDMDEGTNFTDMGLDSLMAITTIANLKSDIGVELPATFFVDNPTIGEAKAALGVSDDTPSATEITLEADPVKATEPVLSSEPVIQVTEIVRDPRDDYDLKRNTKVPLKSPPHSKKNSISSPLHSAKTSLSSPTRFAKPVEREERVQGTEVTAGLWKKPQVDNAKPNYSVKIEDFSKPNGPSMAPPAIKTATDTEPERPIKSASTSPAPVTGQSGLSAKVTTLQGSDGPNVRKLFLLPDWSGSSASYIQLPPLGPELCVFGVESPFKKSKEDKDWTLEDMTTSLLSAIRQKQPKGPYMLGGASFGALYALSVGAKLLEAGEQVQGLLLLDMFVPRFKTTSAVTTEAMVAELEAAGYVPSPKRMTKAKRDHLEQTVQAFQRFKAPRMPGGGPAKTVLLLAKPKSETQPLSWTSSKPVVSGWKDVLGYVDYEEIAAEHQALLRYPQVNVVGERCRDAIEGFSK